VLAVCQRLDEFGDTDVAVVTFTDPARLDQYREQLGITVTVVSDVDRSLYRALGLERGTRRQVWSLGTLGLYWKLLRSGRRLQRTHEDIRQLGGDVVIGSDGRVSTIFRPSTPDARPCVDELLAVL
jgi:hypothetical protein